MSSDNNDISTLALIFLLFGGIGVLGWQAYGYLRFGVWTPISIITVLEWMQIQWAYSPTDWVGLHNIFQSIPLSVAMFSSALLGIGIINQ